MLYYLDTNIVIYALEGQPPFQQRARNHIAALETAGHRFVVGDLTWTECLVLPYRNGDSQMILDYQRFFLGPHITTVSQNAAISQRAALIRGAYRFGLADSLHLATAVEQGVERFLTNDNRLAAFTYMLVEVLP